MSYDWRFWKINEENEVFSIPLPSKLFFLPGQVPGVSTTRISTADSSRLLYILTLVCLDLSNIIEVWARTIIKRLASQLLNRLIMVMVVMMAKQQSRSLVELNNSAKRYVQYRHLR